MAEMIARNWAVLLIIVGFAGALLFRYLRR